MADELEAAGVEVERLNAPGMAKACGFFFDLIEQGRIRHGGRPSWQRHSGGRVSGRSGKRGRGHA